MKRSNRGFGDSVGECSECEEKMQDKKGACTDRIAFGVLV